MTKSITLRHNSSNYILFQNSKMQDFDATKEGQIKAKFFFKHGNIALYYALRYQRLQLGKLILTKKNYVLLHLCG
jgi:hypothetical protein